MKAQTFDMMHELRKAPFIFSFVSDFKEKKSTVKTANIYLLSTCHIQDTQLIEFSQQPFELVLSLALLSQKETKGERNNIPQVTKSTNS